MRLPLDGSPLFLEFPLVTYIAFISLYTLRPLVIALHSASKELIEG